MVKVELDTARRIRAVKMRGVNLVSGLAVALGLMLWVASVVLTALGHASGTALLFIGGALIGAGACDKAVHTIGRKRGGG